MVTSTRTPPQRLGNSKSYSATPSQSPRVNKSGQFSKSPSPKQQGKSPRGYHQAPTTPTPKKMSVARSHSSPMTMPARSTSSPQHGRGSGHGSPNRFGSPQPSSSFAGSKCFEPPTPSSLPKPPTDWFAAAARAANERCSEEKLFSPSLASEDLCTQLKFLLKVEA